MLNYKNIIPVFLLSSSLIAQSMLNGFGIGMRNYGHDASTISLSSSGLVPSFGKNVGLNNPSTWHNLKFTYFSGTYLGNYTYTDDTENGNTLLGNALFIVPIDNKYSFGVGLRPYFKRYLELESIEYKEYIIYEDTLDTHTSYSSYGGISEFNLNIGGKILENINMAMQYSLLYGSSRQQAIFSLNELDYYSQRRYIFTGGLAGIFFSSNFLFNYNIPVNFYAGYHFPIKSISANIAYYKPFEDTNDSGFQDSNDFPSASATSAPTEMTIQNLSSPYEYQIGLDYQIKNGFSILGEYSYWFDKSENGMNISEFNDQIASISHLNFGVAKFAPEIVKNPIDRLNIKLSVFAQNIDLLESEKVIKVYGVSGGVGLNFGRTKNQIDLAYSLGKRNGLIGVREEIIHKYSIGITVGDIWFVKRRAQ